jgi:hypothetical protein
VRRHQRLLRGGGIKSMTFRTEDLEFRI